MSLAFTFLQFTTCHCHPINKHNTGAGAVSTMATAYKLPRTWV